MHMAQRAPKQPIPQPADFVRFEWTPPPRRLFEQAVFARIKQAREKARLTQRQVASALGIEDQSKYAKYEVRTLMPHEYLMRFCEVTGAKIDELLRDPR